MANPVVTFEMANGDVIKAELYPEIAPNTVNNFVSLVNKGFYDGLIFHRVISGFMIQGGCPDGTGMGGPGYSIKGEFKQNGFANDLKHEPGVLSMARAMHPDSAGSQFFIMHKTSPHLDGAYAAFGKVTEGMDVVNKIAETATDYSDRPLEEQKMKKVLLKLLERLIQNQRESNRSYKADNTWRDRIIKTGEPVKDRLRGSKRASLLFTDTDHAVAGSHIDFSETLVHGRCFFYFNCNCSEPTSKMLRISLVWRIRQIKFQNSLKNASILHLFYEFAWL